MDALRSAVQAYAFHHADQDGLAATPVPGLTVMVRDSPANVLHSVYRPLVCLILQGAKNMVVGTQQAEFTAGQSVIVAADMPVAGRIVRADRLEPYIAIAVTFDPEIMTELALSLPSLADAQSVAQHLFTHDTDAAVLDCAVRLFRLVDAPEAIPLLAPGILRELHYWLLMGQHGGTLRAMALPDSRSSRLAQVIADIRANFRESISTERLARIAAMGLTAFHHHFKQLTTLTPGQFQKRLRLIEARRLLHFAGYSASQAAFDVGYQSVPQFTREYARLFGVPPKRHVGSMKTLVLPQNLLRESGHSHPGAGTPLPPNHLARTSQC